MMQTLKLHVFVARFTVAHWIDNCRIVHEYSDPPRHQLRIETTSTLQASRFSINFLDLSVQMRSENDQSEV